jgi:hypothetical protein
MSHSSEPLSDSESNEVSALPLHSQNSYLTL